MNRSLAPPPPTLPTDTVRNKVRHDQGDFIIFVPSLFSLNEFGDDSNSDVRLVAVTTQRLLDSPLELLPPLFPADLRKITGCVKQADTGGQQRTQTSNDCSNESGCGLST